MSNAIVPAGLVGDVLVAGSRAHADEAEPPYLPR